MGDVLIAGLRTRLDLCTGAELLGFWQHEGLVGTTPATADRQAHACTLRAEVERRPRP